MVDVWAHSRDEICQKPASPCRIFGKGNVMTGFLLVRGPEPETKAMVQQDDPRDPCQPVAPGNAKNQVCAGNPPNSADCNIGNRHRVLVHLILRQIIFLPDADSHGEVPVHD